MSESRVLTEEEGRIFLRVHSMAQENVFCVNRTHVLIFGELSTASVLDRIIYWSDRSYLKDGWFYKTADELGKEVCLSGRTVLRAKEKLESLGVIKTEVKQVSGNPTLHWKLNSLALINLEITVGGSHLDTLDDSVSGTLTTACREPIITDNTYNSSIYSATPVQAEKGKPKKFVFGVPDWVPKEAWDAFVEMRKKLGAFTDYAKKLQVAELKRIIEESGGEAEEIINQSIRNSWKGLYPVQKEERGRKGRNDGSVKSDKRTGGAEPRSTKYAGIHQEPL